jgi:hypothetical protein
MRRPILLSTMLCLTAINCTRVDDAAPPADAAQSTNGGPGGSRGLELCGITVTCQDGVLSGMYGNNCSSIAGVCPLGCRVPSAGTSDLGLDPWQFAQSLCVSPAGDAGDASVDDGQVDGVDDAARDGV